MHLKKLGRYDLVRVLGKGAMGVVYEGLDPNLDRHVAIKTIMVDGLGSAAAAEYEERFRTEARSAARLQHPNIVTVYDSDRDGDTAFLVMEFVSGDDLKQLLDGGGRYAVPDALHLVHDLLAALDFAHRQGIIHRDIKPANLLVEKGGRLKLTDFGVARIAGEATRTQGSMIGTLKYMAPEQVQGQKVDSRADLFSAAVVTYQLLTGARPFDGDNDFSIIHQVIGHTPAAPTTLAPALPPGVDSVLARALAKNRDDRFPTAADFWQALREAFSGLDLPVLPAPQAQSRLPSAPSTLPPFYSPASARATTIPGAGITQELELEYWRAVRDSTDPRELEGFLQRFPQGIYADLARRRLQRLASPGDPDHTLLRGMTRVPVAGTGHETTIPIQRPDSTPEDPGEAAERAWQALAQSSATMPPAPAKPVTEPAQARATARPLPAPRKAMAIRIGAAAAIAGVSLVAVLWATRGPGANAAASTAVSPAPAAASAPSTSGSPATTTALAASPAPAVAASSAPANAVAPVSTASPMRTVSTVARAPASAPLPAATLRRAQPGAPSSETTAAATTSSQTVETRAEEVAAAQPASPRTARLVPPAETCKDKFFLVKEFCLQTECAKPGYQVFPACMRLKEEARLRDESRVRN